MSSRESIRAEYLELSAHRSPTLEERAALDERRAALRRRCAHPHLGRGTLPGDFNHPVGPDECPDCGYVADAHELSATP